MSNCDCKLYIYVEFDFERNEGRWLIPEEVKTNFNSSKEFQTIELWFITSDIYIFCTRIEFIFICTLLLK